VLVGHGLFTPFAHANWETETVLDESTAEFDAVLLGDNHAPGIEQVDDVWVTYCGSTERASASEEDERGYNVVGFDADDPGPAGVDIRRRSLSDATREFVFVTADLEPGEGAERVREKIGQHDLDDAVVIVEITGDGDPVTPGEIESFALDNGALIARVTDRREIETETELSVSFADPDAAVDERIEELGLSAAALDIDEAVRSPDIADSNLRETVKSRLKEQIDDDPDALVPPERDDSDASESAAESDSESDVATDSPDDTAADADDTADTDNPADAEAEPDDTAAADSSDDESSADDGTTDDEDTADDGGDTAEGELSTMEDFL
jgi:exonuclease SbcD